jgi:hypothetical protein
MDYNSFQSPRGALKESNKHTKIVFVDWLDSLIGPSGLLLAVSHLLAVPSLSFMMRGWKKVSN